jgi:hypothetical protein
MDNTNSKEEIWHTLKCNDPTPWTVRNWISECLENKDSGKQFTDWTDVSSDGTLFSVKFLSNHFFQIYVYYRMDIECTLTVIKFKDHNYAQKIKQFHLFEDMDTYVLYCEDMDKDMFLDEFEHMYDEFYKFCLRAEYMENQ